MGCARCITSCPTDALEIRDVRNLFRRGLRQDASYLLKRKTDTFIPRLVPAERLPEERIKDWRETEQAVSITDLQQQAGRCLDCGVPGCRNACPLGNYIPDWLEAAANGDWMQAGDLVHSTSTLPEVCGTICPQHRLCEGGCTRNKMEGAVTIGVIERSIVNQALEAGWQPTKPVGTVGRRVAVVGGGPAGLSCAERLNREGVEVTVYDRSTKIGGLLQTGVPSFKLDKSLLDRRHALMEQFGIRFSLGVSVDEAVLSRLLVENDAVFLGLGAQKSRTIKLPGQELPGVDQALDWLKGINAGVRDSWIGQRALVLGGGDTAMDCARAALRLGAQVTVAYRGPEAHLRASPKEVTLAREEGVQFEFEHVPLQCEGVEQVSGVSFSTPDNIHSIESDRVLLALGQLPLVLPWMDRFSISLEDDGRIRVDNSGHTTHPKIWAGGDNTHGSDLAVTAMSAGRRAAEGILLNFNTQGSFRRWV
ncbi:MAG: glutamate synthase subunit beta [Gammaproteobacteria bacterium]|nr:glutamate synthase subunit beta [Gammaproteobacteria bacterium]